MLKLFSIHILKSEYKIKITGSVAAPQSMTLNLCFHWDSCCVECTTHFLPLYNDNKWIQKFCNYTSCRKPSGVSESSLHEKRNRVKLRYLFLRLIIKTKAYENFQELLCKGRTHAEKTGFGKDNSYLFRTKELKHKHCQVGCLTFIIKVMKTLDFRRL